MALPGMTPESYHEGNLFPWWSAIKTKISTHEFNNLKNNKNGTTGKYD